MSICHFNQIFVCTACVDLNHQNQKASFRKNFFSKDCNHVPWLVSDVFVDGEDEHEHEEEASAAKEVPYVMSDIEIKSTRWDFHMELTRHST